MTLTRNNAGFSLIELMIAVAIIGILSGLAYPSYTSHIERARQADVKNDLMMLAQELEDYYSRNNFTYEGANTGSADSFLAANIFHHQSPKRRVKSTT